MSSATRPTLSVVIVTRNEADHIEDCITSVLDLCEDGPPFEVILVDSNSSDTTVTRAADYPVSILRIPDDDLASPAAGRHVGTEYASGEYLLFVDGDMEVTTGWLDDALALVERPLVAGVSGPLEWTTDTTVREDGGTAPDATITGADDDIEWDARTTFGGRTGGFVDSAFVPATESGADHDVADSQPVTDTHPIDALRGVALYDADALAEVGGYDPHLQASEDTDLGYRLWAAGYELHHLSQIVASHPYPETLTEPMRRWRSGYFHGVGQAVRKEAGDPPVLARHLVGLRHPLIAGLWGALGVLLVGRFRRSLPMWGALTAVGLAFYIRRAGVRRASIDIASYFLTLLGIVLGGRNPPPPAESYPLDDVEVLKHATDPLTDPA